MNNIFSVKEYAKMVNLTKEAIFKQIEQKRLPLGVTAQKVGHNFVIIIEKQNG